MPRGDACEIDRLTLETRPLPPARWTCSAMWSSACGMPWTTAPISSATFPPARWKWWKVPSIIRQSTGSAGITTPCSGPTPPLPASTPAGMPSAAYTAAPPHRKRSKPVTARTALPTAGLRWVPTISISRWHRVRKRASSSGWATLKTRSWKNSALPASSTKPGPRP